MVTDTRHVIEECEEQCSTSVTKTSTTMNFSKQNGASSINMDDNMLHSGSASIKDVHLNGLAQKEETCVTGSSEPEAQKSCAQPLTSTGNTLFLNGKCYHENQI
jgi:hypothetical protein